MQPQFRHIAIGFVLGLAPISVSSHAAMASDDTPSASRQTSDSKATPPPSGQTRVTAANKSHAASSKATAKRGVTTSSRPRHAAKIVARAPIDLTPAQRTTVYRSLAQQPVAVAAPARVVTVAPPQTVIAAPPAAVVATESEEIVATVPPAVVTALPPAVVTTAPPAVVATLPQRVVTRVPSDVVATEVVTTPAPLAPVTVHYRIGAPLPQSIPIYDMPPRIAATIPSVRGYRYAMIDDRVLVVDPSSGVVVAELHQ